MARGITTKQYREVKASLKSGLSPREAAWANYLGESTVRRIRLSKNYQDYKRLASSGHLTAAQRQLIKDGATRQEAVAQTTPKLPVAGEHEVANDSTEVLGEPATTSTDIAQGPEIEQSKLPEPRQATFSNGLPKDAQSLEDFVLSHEETEKGTNSEVPVYGAAMMGVAFVALLYFLFS